MIVEHWSSRFQAIGFTHLLKQTNYQSLNAEAGKDASYLEISDSHGHDSFLIDSPPFLRALDVFLKSDIEENASFEEEDGFRKLKNRYEVKKADFRAIDEWVTPNDKVLDLGCGRRFVVRASERNQKG